MVFQTVEFFNQYKYYFNILENFSLIIFFIEYIARLWTYKLHKTYHNIIQFLISPMMIFDALVILPHIINIFLPNILDLRILRIVRVFRIFRLYKYSHTINKIIDITLRHKQVLLSAFSFIMMGVITSATLMYFAEKNAQPETFSSIPQSIYWAVITISTVGYGDFSPVTDLGKIIAIFTTILGVAIYALPTSILGAAFYAELMSKESYLINSLKQENQHLKYLLNNSKRELQTLRNIIKKEREKNREKNQKNQSQKKIKITEKFLNLFK
jgi:voltage-gated potassium channel